jgi:hypothetical protein
MDFVEIDSTYSKKKASPIMAILGVLWLLFGITLLVVQIALPAKIEIQWETETEFNTAGFNIYRSDDLNGSFQQLNEKLIPGVEDAASGGDYSFVDTNVKKGNTYYYRLEDVEFDSSTTLQEPLAATAPSISLFVIGLSAAAIVIGIFMLISYYLKKRIR